MKYGARRRLTDGIVYTLLVVLGILWLLPLLWLLMTSFRGEPGSYTTYFFPKEWTFDNYTRLFTDRGLFDYPRWFANTLFVAVLTCLLSTLSVLCISYTFSRLRFPARRGLMNVGLVLGMFPGFMTMIAVYHLLNAIGLNQSLLGLVLVYSAGNSLQYLVAKGYFDTVSRSLDEAATIDGATRAQIFYKILLPLSKPIVVHTALTGFIAPWVDFIFVSVIMKDNYENYTLALGLYQMLTRENIYRYFTMFCAGAVLVSIPITILFLRLQKFYVEGVTGGAVKG